MVESSQSRWDKRYAESSDKVPPPARVLSTYSYLLPKPSQADIRRRALDLACGRGGNAWYLAQSGFDTYAWDLSSVAVQSLQVRAEAAGIPLHTEFRDVSDMPPPPGFFDVIVISRFLDRNLTPYLIKALKPEGLIFYQTFVVGNSEGPTNPDYLLQSNELLDLFASLTVRAFEDAGHCGRLDQGFRNESLIVAQNSKGKN